MKPDPTVTSATFLAILAACGVYEADESTSHDRTSDLPSNLLTPDDLTFFYREGSSSMTVTIDAERLAAQLDGQTLEAQVMSRTPDGGTNTVEFVIADDMDDRHPTVELPVVGFGTYAVTLSGLSVEGVVVHAEPFVTESTTLHMGEDASSPPVSLADQQRTAASCGPGLNLLGNSDANTLTGGAGNDFIRGKQGADAIYGNGCQDELRGNQGKDALWGGDGDDHLDGGEDADSCWGGLGQDQFTSCKHIWQ